MYVDALHLRESDEIKIVERVNGQRVFNDLPASYVLYFEHPAGTHRSIFGDPCKKFVTNSTRKFRAEINRHKEQGRKIFESDINPVFRCLADHYHGADTPKLHIGYFDIEVDFDPQRGFAPTTDPFNKITAITVYQGWLDKLITLALVPPGLDPAEEQRIEQRFPNTFLFDNEAELLKAFVAVIDDADVLTGWNSTGFDIPYTVNRMIRVLGKDWTRKLCLWDQLPRERKYIKFKREFKTYDLVGRVHLDYLELYQKHNTQQLHSYRLDYVGEIEVGENKTPYSGTLDELYRNDFAKFIEYNRQDVMLLAKIDAKKKFIELANQIAHANTVVLKTTMGSVALVDNAIVNEMHEMGLVVPDRKREADEDDHDTGAIDADEDDDEDGDRTPVVGAYVARPKVGLHDEIGCVDINSLYPSTIRSLNMSPETIVGQFRPDETVAHIAKRVDELGPKKRAEAWDGIFGSLEYEHVMGRDETPLTVDFDDGRCETRPAREWHDIIFNPANHLCVSANGTLFRTDRDGMIPLLLARWYADRKAMQAKQKEFEALAKGIEVSDELASLLGGGLLGD